MAGLRYLCFVFWCLHTGAAAADLAPPHNLTVMTLNTNYTFSWEWEWSAAHSHTVTFTTQYLARFKLKRKSPQWTTVCDETPQRTCDLTALNLHYLGIFMVRIRANVKDIHSDWLQVEFCPDKDAKVGPPTKVVLVPAESNLNVFIYDPVTTANSSMKELLPKLFYNILYWERSGGPVLNVSSHAHLVTLSKLKAWTWYCVSVQSRCDFYNKSSSFTSPHCIQTEGTLPWWQIFPYFLSSLVISLLVMLPALYGSFLFYKTLRATWYPHYQLPTHFQEYCFDSRGSDSPPFLILDLESELLCDQVTICLQPHLLDTPPTAEGLQPDSSCRHSAEVSGSSGDSGVYLTGGCFNLHQPNSNQSEQPSAPELVKMQEMKSQA